MNGGSGMIGVPSDPGEHRHPPVVGQFPATLPETPVLPQQSFRRDAAGLLVREPAHSIDVRRLTDLPVPAGAGGAGETLGDTRGTGHRDKKQDEW